ncbi:hypothetical protein ACB092_02G134700 [Castanea dentata]
MNPDPQESSPQTPKKEVQIQGPRPPPLRVSKDSHKIKKPPPHPPPKLPLKPFQNPYQQQPQPQQPHQPVIIYSVSPKVIHASSASDFMSIVQRLTGSSTSSSSASASYSGSGDLSPAARLASIEKTSPSERDRERANSTNTTTAMLEEEEVEVVEILGQAATHPGILSPAPATLAPIPDGFFSPLIEPQGYSLMHELSPLWHNAFMASPSGLFSAPLVSPSPSSMDLFNHFMDF